MVKLTAGSNQWSGVMIESSGIIVTTSLALGSSPLASFRTFDGSTGQAWVVGRDDNLDLAVLEVINAAQTFDAISMHTGDLPDRNEPLVLMHYGVNSVTPDKASSGLVGSRQDTITGIDYLQLSGFSAGNEQGGAAIDANGVLRGLRMDSDRMIQIGIGRIGEVWAMDAFALSSAMVPRLKAGVSVILGTDGKCTELGAPPPIPAIFKGDITVGGSPLAIGQRVYARVTATATGKELWFSSIVVTAGRYFITVSICDPSFNTTSSNTSVVDFWFDANATSTTSVYDPSIVATNNLTF
jgi:hypothetical protein